MVKKKFKFTEKRGRIAKPPRLTPEQRLANLQTNRDELIDLLAQKRAQGDYDANAPAIRTTLEATLDIINYLISLYDRDKRRAR